MLGFIEPKPFETDKDYQSRRKSALKELYEHIVPGFNPRQKNWRDYWCKVIDSPLVHLVLAYDRLSHCFLIQNCHGHFIPLMSGLDFPMSLEPVSSYPLDSQSFEYREAFMLFCLENSKNGRRLFSDLQKITSLDSNYIQFGSSDCWKIPNTYVLQIEPEDRKKDEIANVSREEALYIESLIEKMFKELWRIYKRHQRLIRI